MDALEHSVICSAQCLCQLAYNYTDPSYEWCKPLKLRLMNTDSSFHKSPEFVYILLFVAERIAGAFKWNLATIF